MLMPELSDLVHALVPEVTVSQFACVFLQLRLEPIAERFEAPSQIVKGLVYGGVVAYSTERRRRE